MTTAFVALGSNLGDREALLRAAIKKLDASAGVRVTAVSAFRETAPVGGPPGQPRFLNAVVRLETSLTPRALLELLLATEAALGRVRDPAAPRWGPRLIDLDLLLHGEARMEDPGPPALTLPHPRLLERPFVTEPLAEIAPGVLDALRRERYKSNAMEHIDTIARMRAFAREARAAGKTIGFVPTMGALHEGHLSLVRRAKAENDVVVTSIFVNPLQFGPSEDYARYPRDLEGDRALLLQAGSDVLYTTTPEEMYPPGYRTYVTQDDLTTKLEGASRPTHFRGVLTIVLKLFHIVAPHRAYFGRKDFQQTVVLRRMVADLDLDVAMVVCPTVREADGLAMSSRNRYLSPEERARAVAISRGLGEAERRFRGGERSAAILRATIQYTLEKEGGAAIDYVAIVDPETLDPVDPVRPGDYALVAVWFGRTRLIDNTPFLS